MMNVRRQHEVSVTPIRMTGMSKGRLIEYVEKQTSEIDELKAQNESQNERIQKLEELVQSLMAAR